MRIFVESILCAVAVMGFSGTGIFVVTSTEVVFTPGCADGRVHPAVRSKKIMMTLMVFIRNHSFYICWNIVRWSRAG
jgi:hypothetical protein